MEVNNNDHDQQFKECWYYLRQTNELVIKSACNDRIIIHLSADDYFSSINYSPANLTVDDLASALLDKYCDMLGSFVQRDIDALGGSVEQLHNYIKQHLIEASHEYIQNHDVTDDDLDSVLANNDIDNNDSYESDMEEASSSYDLDEESINNIIANIRAIPKPKQPLPPRQH